ncbi:MAG TPA: leucine zipper domain-containing protein [Burkholderiales bacterium]|nr:leucine zipper domain-containing protein [Burkholderiales bacterium]
MPDLTLARRLELVREIVDKGLTEPTARKWLGRYPAEGEGGLHDRSSFPRRIPRKIKPEKPLAIVELRRRRRRLTQARIAASLGPPKALSDAF